MSWCLYYENGFIFIQHRPATEIVTKAIIHLHYCSSVHLDALICIVCLKVKRLVLEVYCALSHQKVGTLIHSCVMTDHKPYMSYEEKVIPITVSWNLFIPSKVNSGQCLQWFANGLLMGIPISAFTEVPKEFCKLEKVGIKHGRYNRSIEKCWLGPQNSWYKSCKISWKPKSEGSYNQLLLFSKNENQNRLVNISYFIL